MADNGVGGLPPLPFKGLNINVHPTSGGWVIEITPNPLTVSQAFQPDWRAVFPLAGVPKGEVFTLVQFLPLFAQAVVDIATERLDAILVEA